MKVFVVLATFFVVAFAADDYCYRDATQACKSGDVSTKSSDAAADHLEKCNAKYGGIEFSLVDLQTYATTHIMRSYEYLLMSTHFANYEKNRAGFEKLYRSLSDETWEDAINLIKYMTKRGGAMKFTARKKDELKNGNTTYELYELESLARALDMQKLLAKDAITIHEKVSHHKHDPEIMSHIEEHFAEKHAESIRKLSGHVADLKKMLSGEDRSLALFMFDEYLQKM